MTPETQDKLPPERLAEASVWIARLHSGEHDAAAVAGVKAWLCTSELNSRAFEVCTDVWEESEGLRKYLAFAGSTRPVRSRGYWLPVTIAAATILALFVGVLLYSKGNVSTGVGEQRLLTLKDGSRVFLNTSTHVRVRYGKQERDVNLEGGEAMFDVAKHADWPFIVKAGGRLVHAVGTSFVIRQEDAQTTVTLVEGKVTITADDTIMPTEHSDGSQREAELTLAPGEQATFAPNHQITVDQTSVEKATAWRRGQVVLDNVALAQAVSEMNRYSNTKLTLERTEIATLPISGLFQAGDSINFARAVAEAYGLVVIEHPAVIILSGAPKDRHFEDQ